MSITSLDLINLFYKAQIVLLKSDGVFTIILLGYADFPDVFSSILAMELLDHTKINNYTMNLIDSKQPFYEIIYSLEPMKLVTLKTYIKINLTNNFIKSSKFLTIAPIFIILKSDNRLCLYINY